ncbi:MAG: MFS transporter [Frankia sp.]
MVTAADSLPDPGIVGTFRDAPPAVRSLLAGTLINRLGTFLQLFLVLFLTARGFSAVQAGAALGGYGAGLVAGVLLGGTFTDRVGARRTITFSMATAGILLIAIAYLRYYPALLVTVALVGAAGQMYRPAAASLLARLTAESRQVMVFAMSRLALNLGAMLAPLIGAALVAVSYTLLFWGEALASFAYAALAFFTLPREQPATGVPLPRGEREAGPEPIGDPAAAPGDSRLRRRNGYLAVLADRRFAAFLAAAIVNAMVYVQYLAALPLAMRAAGFATVWFSVVVALNGLVVVTCELPMTTIVRRWPVRAVFPVAFPLLALGQICYALPGGLEVFVIGTLVWSLAETIQGPTLFAYPAQAGPERLRGRYLGASQATFGIGSALGPVIGIALWTMIGTRFWLVCGAASVLAIIPSWYGMRPRAAR